MKKTNGPLPEKLCCKMAKEREEQCSNSGKQRVWNEV